MRVTQAIVVPDPSLSAPFVSQHSASQACAGRSQSQGEWSRARFSCFHAFVGQALLKKHNVLYDCRSMEDAMATVMINLYRVPRDDDEVKQD